MKTLIYNKKQLEQMLKDRNKYNDMGRNDNILFPLDIDFIKKQFPELPEEGLLVSAGGSLVYKLSDGSGYGFVYGNQSDYYFNKLWEFSADYWKPATPEQEKNFIEMLKKECENRGLFKDTKIEKYGINSDICSVNMGVFSVAFEVYEAWNINGRIFQKGKFAKPLKESTLDQVTDAVKGIADFTIEETESKLIILTPINK